MKPEDDDSFFAGVALARKINRSAADKFAEKGLTSDQIAIGAMWSAYDIAEALHEGKGIAAIEWMRSAIDIMEGSILNGDREPS